VIINRRKYDRLVPQKRSFSEAWREFSRSISLAELQADPDDVFADVRDVSPGRSDQLSRSKSAKPA
jgi:hypothetical protein